MFIYKNRNNFNKILKICPGCPLSRASSRLRKSENGFFCAGLPFKQYTFPDLLIHEKKKKKKKKPSHNFSFLKHISVTCSISSPSSVAINSLLYCLGLSPALNAFALKTLQVWGQNLQPLCTLLWIRADEVAFQTTGVKQKTQETSSTSIQNIIHRSPSSPASGKIQEGVCQLE